MVYSPQWNFSDSFITDWLLILYESRSYIKSEICCSRTCSCDLYDDARELKMEFILQDKCSSLRPVIKASFLEDFKSFLSSFLASEKISQSKSSLEGSLYSLLFSVKSTMMQLKPIQVLINSESLFLSLNSSHCNYQLEQLLHSYCTNGS